MNVDLKTLVPSAFAYLFFILAVILYSTVYLSWKNYTKETRRYREVIKRSEDILKFSGEFFLFERPNDDKKYVQIRGEKFHGQHVFLTAIDDIKKLEKGVGCLVKPEYLFDNPEPPSEEEFQDRLSLHYKKLGIWFNENQGHPYPEKMPNAPYDTLKVTVTAV